MDDIDIDTDNTTDVPEDADSLDEIRGRDKVGVHSTTLEEDPDQDYDLPGDEIVETELMVRVVPQQKDEFRCNSCFLVRHRSQLATSMDDPMCKDCAE